MYNKPNYFDFEILNFSLFYATLKSVGYYVIPSIQKLRLSVRLYVRPSVNALFLLSAGSIFNQFSSNLL